MGAVYVDVSNNFSTVSPLLLCKYLLYFCKRCFPVFKVIPKASGDKVKDILSYVQEGVSYLVNKGTNVFIALSLFVGVQWLGNKVTVEYGISCAEATVC
jgi:hypothetical protein